MKITSIKDFYIRRGILFFAAFVLIGCSSKRSDLGLSIQDSDGFIEGELIDTFTVTTWTALDDEVSSPTRFGAGMMGQIKSDNFGETFYSFNSQLIPVGTVGTIEGTAVVDSVVLTLAAYDQYGHSSSLDFKVERITEDILEDQDYFVDDVIMTDGVDLVRSDVGPFPVSSVDSVLVGGVMTAPHVRIQLENSFGAELLTAVNNGDFNSIASTKAYLKGLSISPINNALGANEGVVANINTLSGSSYMTVYYTDTAGSKTFVLQYYNNLLESSDEKCYGFNGIVNDPSSALLGNILADTTLGNQSFVIQSGIGSGRIAVPSLSYLKDSNYIVNRAELFIPAEYYIGSPYYNSAFLYLAYVDENGDVQTIYDNIDRSTSNQSTVGVQYNSVQKGYNMICTQHLQRVVSGEITADELILRNTRFYTSAEGTVLNGPETPLKGQVYFKIYVTKY